MACVLVHTDVTDRVPTASALAVLGEGRRIGSALGASVYAVAWVPPGADSGDAAREVVAALGRGGADRVVLVAAPQAPMLWMTRGPALARICEQVRPTLVLLAADPGGHDVAARLAARMGAVFVSEPAVEAGSRGEVVLTRMVYDGELWRRVQLDEIEQPAVVTLSPDRHPASGGDDAELVPLGADLPRPPAPRTVATATDPGDGLAAARVVVVAGAGVTAATLPLVQELARVLGGEVAGTRAACARGLIGAEREVGIGARRVHPHLYVVCGASGSSAHLGAVAPGAAIVAIDRDPRAPIWKAATWGLVGTLEDHLPALIAALGPS